MRRASWLLVAVTGGAALAVARAALLVVRVDGRSMEPTFEPGAAVLTIRRPVHRRPRRDDIVVCRLPDGAVGPPDAYLVKRVVAVAGEPMPGEPERRLVPDGHVFVRGDGPRSLDSRAFGPIPVDHVVGRVVARLTRPAR